LGRKKAIWGEMISRPLQVAEITTPTVGTVKHLPIQYGAEAVIIG
jgi:hypothetical protein